jgi:hypothetical protein
VQDGTDDDLQINHLPFAYLAMVPNSDFELDEEKSYTEFKLDPDATFVIDGAPISADEFVKSRRTQAFHHLLITDSHVKLPIKARGELDAKDGTLKLSFDMSGLTQLSKHKVKKNIQAQWLYKRAAREVR